MNEQTDYISAETFRPRNDNVLIRWCAPPETTPSGLVALPRSDYARAIDGRFAEVVALGDGPAFKRKCERCGAPRDGYGMELHVGDKVIVDGRKCGEIIVYNGEECRVVRQAELLAVIEDQCMQEQPGSGDAAE